MFLSSLPGNSGARVVDESELFGLVLSPEEGDDDRRKRDGHENGKLSIFS
jgi:hypothetical protein